jgi:hypothetical protein
MLPKQEEDHAKELEKCLSPSSHNLLSSDNKDDALTSAASPVSVIDPSISDNSMFSFNKTTPNLNGLELL